MRTLIIDGHLDMGFNALFNQRDLTQSIQVLREREDSLKFKLGPYETDPGTVTVSLPELRRGACWHYAGYDHGAGPSAVAGKTELS